MHCARGAVSKDRLAPYKKQMLCSLPVHYLPLVSIALSYNTYFVQQPRTSSSRPSYHMGVGCPVRSSQKTTAAIFSPIVRGGTSGTSVSSTVGMPVTKSISSGRQNLDRLMTLYPT